MRSEDQPHEGTDMLEEIENVRGWGSYWEQLHRYHPDAGDIIHGDDGPNVISGLSDSDQIFGHGGDDHLDAGVGE